MKKCPKCGELLGDNVDVCFNCRFDFVLQQNTDEEKVNAYNDTYEYMVFAVEDKEDGRSDIKKINALLNDYATQKWKLHSIYINEIGKTGSAVGMRGLITETNATIDQTIIVLERIKDRAISASLKE